MKFIMVEKGYEYKTDDDLYTIRKSYERRHINSQNYASPMLAPVRTVSCWSVYPVGKHCIHVFRTLKEAKAFIMEDAK